MSKRVFDARLAPEEEIRGVRATLDEAGIQYYETKTGTWGFGSAGLWLRDPADYARARALIDEFQARWLARARSETHTDGIRWSMVPLLVGFVALLVWAFSTLLTSLGG